MTETFAARIDNYWGTMIGVVSLVSVVALATFIIVGPVVLAVTFEVSLVAAMHRVVVAGSIAYLLIVVGLLR